jgi:hypothetical protein
MDSNLSGLVAFPSYVIIVFLIVIHLIAYAMRFSSLLMRVTAGLA